MTTNITEKLPTDGQVLPGMSNASHAYNGLSYMSLEHALLVDGSPTGTHMQDAPMNVPTVKPFVPAVKPSKFVLAHLANAEYAKRYQQCVALTQSWSLGRLQKYYKAEYNSMRSRKQQAKARHLGFDNRLKDFRDWLIHLGPRPDVDWTVHRMNNYKGYKPGNVKWATKIEQTEIRKVTKWHAVDGKMLTTQGFAKHLGITYTCLYKRLQNGWTTQRLLDDRKKQTGIKGWQFPATFVFLLEPLYAKRKTFNKPRIDWFIDHLSKQAQKNCILPDHEEGVALLFKAVKKAEEERAVLLKQQDELEELEFQQLVNAIKPVKVEGFN